MSNVNVFRLEYCFEIRAIWHTSKVTELIKLVCRGTTVYELRMWFNCFKHLTFKKRKCFKIKNCKKCVFFIYKIRQMFFWYLFLKHFKHALIVVLLTCAAYYTGFKSIKSINRIVYLYKNLNYLNALCFVMYWNQINIRNRLKYILSMR